MRGERCDIGDSCARTFKTEETKGQAQEVSSKNSTGKEETTSSKTGAEFGLGFKIANSVSASANIGLKDTPVHAGFEAKIEAVIEPKASYKYEHNYAKTVRESQSFGMTNQTSFSVSFATTETRSRPAYAEHYCGGWFAVPILGL